MYAPQSEPSAAPLREPWWRHVRDAIRGRHHDYTDGPIGRSLMLLAVPMVLETLMESLFAVVDVFFVAKLGADAVATVGLTESMLFVIYSIAMGLGIGATALVSRRIGERDPEGAARTAVQSILLGIIVSAVIGVVGVILAPTFLRLLGASPAILEVGTTYTRIVLGGNIVIMMLYMINAIFRGAGDAAIAMRVLWFANFINIVLGPCFICACALRRDGTLRRLLGSRNCVFDAGFRERMGVHSR